MKKILDRTLETITVALFVIMIVVGSWQVISRYVFNSPSTVTEEFLRFSLIWLAMLAAAYVIGRNTHIAITMLRDKLKDGPRVKLDILVQIIFILFAAIIMLFGGGKATSLTMGQISPSLGIPMGLIYLSLPVSGVFALFYSTYNILNLLKEKKEIEVNSKRNAA
ncbi:TRAP transporter small permease [Bacillus sp. PS06]|nr:TRAP transporter small permease [Bacillus sp. PS06]